MSSYLYLFTIPSVQEFISHARKTHDLYAGSKIFNDLMKFAAVDLFQNKFGGELIFPVVNDNERTNEQDALGSSSHFTNRFLGFIDFNKANKNTNQLREKKNNETKETLSFIGSLIEEAVKTYWFILSYRFVEYALSNKISDYRETQQLNKSIKDEVIDIVKEKINNPDHTKIDLSGYEQRADDFVIGFKDQIKSALNIVWAFVEYDEQNDDYQEKYQLLERIIGAKKEMRDFEQFHYQMIDSEKIYGERGRKCSVDGIRNVKFYRLLENELERYKKNCERELDRLFNSKLFVEEKNREVLVFLKSIWDDSDIKICREYIYEKVNDRYLQPGEGLSAVSMVKRAYNQPFDFASTAEISLCSIFYKAKEKYNDKLTNLRDKFHLEADKDYLALLAGNKSGTFKEFDYQWFYKENEQQAKDSLYSNFRQYFHDLVAVRDLLKKDYGNFPKYYAVVKMDGDSMGEHLGNVKSIREHKQISERLSKFSQEVMKLDYTNDNNHDKLARVIYSGGDDVLAFVNLEYLFEFLKEARSFYTKYLCPGDNKENCKFTISAGVAIAHYKTPLQTVLKEARAALENKAKEMDGKDAVAFTVLRRSGETTTTVWKWKVNNDLWITDVIDQLVRAIKQGIISTNFIQTLQLEFEPILNELKDDENFNLIEALKTEIVRLFNRSKSQNIKGADETLNGILDNLKKIIEQLSLKKDIVHFFELLNLVDFLSRKTTKD